LEKRNRRSLWSYAHSIFCWPFAFSCIRWESISIGVEKKKICFVHSASVFIFLAFTLYIWNSDFSLAANSDRDRDGHEKIGESERMMKRVLFLMSYKSKFGKLARESFYIQFTHAFIFVLLCGWTVSLQSKLQVHNRFFRFFIPKLHLIFYNTIKWL
jgi:hypothetical protein